ncbi:putative HNH endonuclease [Klebsiella phage vB_KpnD_Opt-79]|uniref:HNH endonuclease n=1 Tax=Escherichia phage vB_EcoD_Sadiya TaxID=2902684 RepID=A0AC61TRI9_9CAUD|nr:HNH endonuclease [Escherichia phage vB_EcoD_Opt-719]UGO52801.1 putative HNH endonuclease [Klebsiella phage vB_KpnD_Opt-79]UGV22555.1 putative HNH endonuclease [Escherichia phage vB_ EcoD_Phleasolo]UGV22723.1 HNH endonuclease [Escherichia phage vB_EcoD_Sadiya]
MNWHDIFEYIDGCIIWRASGNVAGYKRKDGYVIVTINGKKILAHRIIYEMNNGDIEPGMQIDHIDHNPSNNRIENLRVVNHQENQSNKSKQSNNTSGVTGVWLHKKSGRFVAEIMVEKKKIHIGYFDDKLNAAKARKDAEIKFGFHKNHGK